MKGVFECLPDELRYEIARHYQAEIDRESENMDEKDQLRLLFILMAILPRGAEIIHEVGEEIRQEGYDQTAAELLQDVDIDLE